MKPYLRSIILLFFSVIRGMSCGGPSPRALFFTGLLLPLFMVACRQTEPTATPELAIAATPTAVAATPTVIREESPPTVESEVVPEEGYVDPLAEVEWVLKATLPEEPVTAGVFRLPAPDKRTIAEVRQLATQFGLPGEIYFEVPAGYEVPEDDAAGADFVEQMIEQPFTAYHSFGVTQTLFASYDDTKAVISYRAWPFPASYEYSDPANLLPFDQAAPIATAFLTEGGLLDFPYQVVPGYGGEVQFLRLVEGRPVVTPTHPELTVYVNTAGQVFSVSYVPQHPLTLLGEYPLLSAPEAWQRIQAGTSEAFHWNFYPARPQVVEAPPDDLPATWYRTYRVGQQANLYAYLSGVYWPAEGDGPPRIELGTFWLQATEAELWAIAAHAQDEFIHAWGTVKDISTLRGVLELAGWEVIPVLEDLSFSGAIQQADGQTLLLTDTGQTLLLPDAPADLPDGYRVRVSGSATGPADGPYPVFEWGSIVALNERSEEGVTGAPPVENETLTIRQVVITEVDLVYDYQAAAYMGARDSEGLPLNLLPPAWRFTGTTDAGDKIEFIVLAVAAELVEPK